MDTTYYTLQTRKIKASGGAELVTFVPRPQAAPKTAQADPPAGEVLNFDLCRRHLETRTAWKGLTAAALSAGTEAGPEPVAEVEAQLQAEVEPIPYRPVPRRENRTRVRAHTPWMELLTSALALGFVCLAGAFVLLNIV